MTSLHTVLLIFIFYNFLLIFDCSGHIAFRGSLGIRGKFVSARNVQRIWVGCLNRQKVPYLHYMPQRQPVFMQLSLRMCLERHVSRLILLPIFGSSLLYQMFTYMSLFQM